MFDPTFALKLTFRTMKVLFCTEILNGLITIRSKIIIAVSQLKKKKKTGKYCQNFLFFLKFLTFEGT